MAFVPIVPARGLRSAGSGFSTGACSLRAPAVWTNARTVRVPLVCLSAQADEVTADEATADVPVDANNEIDLAAPAGAAAAEDSIETPSAEGSVEVEASGEAIADRAESATDMPAEKKRRGSPSGQRRGGKPKRVITLKLEDMTVGMELEGTVKSTTAYGAFVGDMGTPTDGLLHVSQLTNTYVENVTDVVQVGEKIKVRVLSVDLEKGNFSLTMKPPRLADGGSADGSGASRGAASSGSSSGAPSGGASRGGGGGGGSMNAAKWKTFTFDPETFINAKVVSVTDFGAFCKIINEEGEEDETVPTDGLVHISELSEGRVSDVASVVSVDQVVKVRITSADRKRNRISLSLREYKANEGATVAEDMAANAQKQPQFRTSMELAFERAKPKSS